MTAVLERPTAVATEADRSGWLASDEDLMDYRAMHREDEADTSVYTMALLAGSGPLLRDGVDVRVPPSPAPSDKPVTQRSWAKVTTSHAEKSSRTEELPRLMRLWFAAIERCDSDGRADFDSGELAGILGCAERTVRSTIAQGKRCGQLGEKSDARHVYLIGVANERPSAHRVARRRRAEGAVHQYATTRPRK